MQEASVAATAHALGQHAAILDRAEAHAEVGRIGPATLVEAQVAPDTVALARQVRAAADTAEGGYPDTEATLPELKERVATALPPCGRPARSGRRAGGRAGHRPAAWPALCLLGA